MVPTYCSMPTLRAWSLSFFGKLKGFHFCPHLSSDSSDCRYSAQELFYHFLLPDHALASEKTHIKVISDIIYREKSKRR